MTEIFNILIKKTNNCATTEELKLLNNWIRQDISNKIVEKQFINVWQWQESEQRATKEQVWQSVSKITENKTIDYTSNFTVSESTHRVGWYKVAAVVSVLLVSLAALVYFTSIKDASPKNAEIKYKEYITSASESKKILLPDNSEITLKANSLLKVPPPSVFSMERKVDLEGQALFHINSNQSKSFEITSPSFKTTVTGTVFSISDYREDNIHEVVLLQGKLSVNLINKQDEVKLKEGQGIFYKNNTGKYVKKDIKSELTDWLGNNLVFESDDFDTVVKKLERYFNVKIDVHSDFTNEEMSFNGVFYETDSIEDILIVISKQFDFTYEILTNGDVLIN